MPTVNVDPNTYINRNIVYRLNKACFHRGKNDIPKHTYTPTHKKDLGARISVIGS